MNLNDSIKRQRICKHILFFFATPHCNAKKNKKSLQATAPEQCRHFSKFETTPQRTDRSTNR